MPFHPPRSVRWLELLPSDATAAPTPQPVLSQPSLDLVGGVKSDLAASFAMIGSFLQADVGHNEGQGEAP